MQDIDYNTYLQSDNNKKGNKRFKLEIPKEKVYSLFKLFVSLMTVLRLIKD